MFIEIIQGIGIGLLGLALGVFNVKLFIKLLED